MTKSEINFINTKDVNIEDATPAMQKFLEIKREHSDAVLMYRMGDFYETFFEDAVLISKELELTLTGRECGRLGRIPLAGIPVKSLDTYLEKLVEKDFKVAICEQLEDPKFAKGIVKRGVVRIVTAGTLLESNLLNQNSNNYMCAMFEESGKYGFAYTDISTGEFKTATLDYDSIKTELARIQPAEIVAPIKKLKLEPFQIVPEEVVDLPDEITKFYNCSKVPFRVFEDDFAQNNLKAVFKLNSLDSLGYKDNPLAYRASAGLLAYIWENMKDGFPRFEKIEPYELSGYVALDVHTRKNLELTQTLREKNRYGSLLWAIDKTKTNMGARLLKSWICQPLKDLEEIKNRHYKVQTLVENSFVRSDLDSLLTEISDIQRLSTRMSNGTDGPREFINLKNSLKVLPRLVETVDSINLDVFSNVKNELQNISEFADLIERTINESPPILIKDGDVIKAGVNNTLDYLRD